MNAKLWKILGIFVIVVLIASAMISPAYAASETGGPDWDRSSLSVTGACSGGAATFTVTNGGSGNMAGTTTYTWSDEGGNSGSGTIPALLSGQTYTFSISGVGKVSVVVYQRPGHPGTGRAKADAGPCSPPPPPQYCQQTIAGPINWSGWTEAADGLSRSRVGTQDLYDANDTSHYCGTNTYEETQYLYCLADGETSDWYYQGQEPEGATQGKCAPPPPQYCVETITGTTVWGDWVVAPDGLSRTRTGSTPLFDKNDPTHSCGFVPVSETQYLYCVDGTSDWYYEGQQPEGAVQGQCEEDEVIRICYLGQTMTVKVTDLVNYPGYTEGECPSVVVTPTPDPYDPWKAPVCKDCGAPQRETLPEWGLVDIAHDDGSGCFDWTRDVINMMFDGATKREATRWALRNAVRWGCRVGTLHTVESTVPFWIWDGQAYQAFAVDNGKGGTIYRITVTIRQPWWEDFPEFEQAALARLDENGNPMPIVSDGFLIRGDQAGTVPIVDYAFSVDPTRSFEKLDYVVCSLWPSIMVNGQGVTKWYSMNESDLTEYLREEFGYNNDQVKTWLENSWRPAKIGDVVPIPAP